MAWVILYLYVMGAIIAWVAFTAFDADPHAPKYTMQDHMIMLLMVTAWPVTGFLVVLMVVYSWLCTLLAEEERHEW